MRSEMAAELVGSIYAKEKGGREFDDADHDGETTSESGGSIGSGQPVEWIEG